ncbi:CDGP domain-containing protein [Mycolicibacterium grossiae]|uniref:CDGP domain-containing protein n=1 Tax=Mycolicibacterium grossiae TaxID=1552759 RepID=A0A1E8Q3Q0_9MYCO|nr:hypothetical protein [Mycolicibacterium grossiae]OFJ53125.1 hypothetical protein BEL07_13910 [Mycolicibacterium grossiae]QEM44767.1 hypothetical protein FZ046_08200 [Mycolicibacterium grossiae]
MRSTTPARLLLTAALTTAAAGAALGFAAPASAGCETQPTHQYCDLPVRPDGTFDRCLIVFGHGIAGVGDYQDTRMRCYPVDPTNIPYNEPRHHIDP